MFEFKIAFKYLLFKKRRFSSSLISLLSILVISLVVWLVLVFLSVTNGIEKNWLSKLTALNAPIRIAPNDEYYSSYYYLVDSLSSNSNYSTKTIKEKLESDISDPYDSEMDMELPSSFPKPLYTNNTFIDPIKGLYTILQDQQTKNFDISFQDYEISAALMRLTLNRVKKDLFTEFKDEKVSFLTQMSYLLSLTENNPNLKSLILNPSNNDLNHLLYQMDKSYDNIQKDVPNYPKKIEKSFFQKRLNDLFENISIEKISLEKGFPLNIELIKAAHPIRAVAIIEKGYLSTIIITNTPNHYPKCISGQIIQDGKDFYFKTTDSKYKIVNTTVIHLGEAKNFLAKLDYSSLDRASSFKDIKLYVTELSENPQIEGMISLNNVKLDKVNINSHTSINPNFYSYSSDNKVILPSHDDKTGILLPKNYQNGGVLIGDSGYLSYASMTMNSNQEMRLPIFVAGFYDPGVLPIGNKCLIVPSHITKTINATNNSFNFDGTPTNGVYVWTKDIKNADNLTKSIKSDLKKNGLDAYFSITTYKDFEFSKDLMQQFQSDRTLFTIIAIIILTAACTNIISMLVLLVNDKKKEIAILRSMGASSKSIAAIFGFCGFFMGLISSLIGISAAILTLRHLDIVIKLLSAIQGHTFFNAAFFGNKLPNALSMDALIFVLILTPILALIAGLVPAIKASKIHVSSILRS